MKLKLLIALAALVPSLVMAQAGIHNNPANVGSTGQPGGFQPPPTATTPGQPGANQQQTATNPSGGSLTGFGGKVDGHGSSDKATVKGSSQGSTYTNPCSSAYTCN